MFETMKRLYAKTKNKDLVRAAVKKNPTPWITPEQYEEITGEKYVK